MTPLPSRQDRTCPLGRLASRATYCCLLLPLLCSLSFSLCRARSSGCVSASLRIAMHLDSLSLVGMLLLPRVDAAPESGNVSLR